MTYTERRRTIGRLIAMRVAVSTILLGWATVARIAAPRAFTVDPFFVLAGVIYALTIPAAWTLRLVEAYPGLVDAQLVADAFIVSAFIYLTGGVTSYFSSLYVLPIIAASIVQLRRGGILVASVSAALYTGLVALQYLHAADLLPFSALAGTASVLPSRSIALYTVALNLFGFFGV